MRYFCFLCRHARFRGNNSKSIIIMRRENNKKVLERASTKKGLSPNASFGINLQILWKFFLKNFCLCANIGQNFLRKISTKFENLG